MEKQQISVREDKYSEGVKSNLKSIADKEKVSLSSLIWKILRNYVTDYETKNK